jgi:hypothetical protein
LFTTCFVLLDGDIVETADRNVIRLLKVLTEVLKMMENNDEVDQNFKKIPRLILAILTQMMTLLDNSNPATEKVI